MKDFLFIVAKPCPGLSVFNYQYKAQWSSQHHHGYNHVVFVSNSYNVLKSYREVWKILIAPTKQ